MRKRIRQGYSLSPLPFNIEPEFSASAVKKEEDIKDTKISEKNGTIVICR